VKSAQIVSADNIAVVEQGAVQSGPTLSGTLVAENEAAVKAQIASTVVATYGDVGTSVKRGTVLVRLDDRTLRDAVLSARSAARSTQTALDNAKREVTRQERLLAIEAVAQTEVETARANAATAEANLADARSRLTSAEQQAAYATVTAPINGVISEKSVSTGDAVQVGGALYTIVDPSSMRVDANVPAEARGSIHVGTRVSFDIRGYPNRSFEGHISRISPSADPSTRQVRVIASIPNAGSTLVAGLFASGRAASESATGLVVAASAIDRRQVSPSIARIRRGQVEHVGVTLGVTDETTQRVQIVSGATLGDTLLTGSAQQLAAGSKVTISRNDTPTQVEAKR
jgi:RND family efflux transporter MFP subunit